MRKRWRTPTLRSYAQLAAMMITFTLCPPLLIIAMFWDAWQSKAEYDAWLAEEDDDLYRASYGVHGRPL